VFFKIHMVKLSLIQLRLCVHNQMEQFQILQNAPLTCLSNEQIKIITIITIRSNNNHRRIDKINKSNNNNRRGSSKMMDLGCHNFNKSARSSSWRWKTSWISCKGFNLKMELHLYQVDLLLKVNNWRKELKSKR